jgi:ferredoxin
MTLSVNSGETILDVLKENGIAIASSCCQGACGTCKVAVIEGEVDHQDVHLTDVEKRENAYVMTCVSRAKSDRLVLDI